MSEEKKKDIQLFRCSSLGKLMTNGKGKNNTSMGATAKAEVRKAFLKNEYGYHEEVITDEMTKGNLCEAQSRMMIHKHLGGEPRFLYGNKLQKGNLGGTPDIVLSQESCIEDVKNPYSLRTFVEKELDKDYMFQGMGYMYLAEKERFRLIYTLNPTPQDIIESEKRRVLWKFGGYEDHPDYQRIANQMDHNNDLILDLTLEQRIKVFEVEYDPLLVNSILSRLEEAADYYESLRGVLV